MTSDDKTCIQCGRPSCEEGAWVYCDYHHAQALKTSELAIESAFTGREPQIECSHCHNLSDLDTTYWIENIRLCKACYQKDKSLWK